MKTSTATAGELPGGPLLQLARAWNGFWFSPADPTVLGFIRICCGLVTLYVHLAYTVDLQTFFGENAWVDRPTVNVFRQEMPWGTESWNWTDLPPYDRYEPPRDNADRAYMQRWHTPDSVTTRAGRRYGVNPDLVKKGYYAWSIWYHVTDPAWMWVIHVGVLVIMLLFTIGFCTRITSVLTWLAALSYIQRGATSLFGQDTMMNMVLLYLMIGPSGAALSVDRLIRRYWLTWRALRAHRPAPVMPPPAPSVSANLAIRLLQINLCFIYLVAGLSKLQGQTWWNGTAIWLTLCNGEFSPLWFGPYQAFLRFLCQNDKRWLWELCMTGGVAFTFFVELGFPFLVWHRRMRWVMLVAALAMHTGIALSMGLRTFSLMMLVLDLSFVPPEALHWLLRPRDRGLRRAQLRYSSRSRGQVRAASVIHALDVFNQIELADVSSRTRPAGETAHAVQAARPALGAAAPGDGRRVELLTPAGKVVTSYNVIAEHLLQSLALLWPWDGRGQDTAADPLAGVDLAAGDRPWVEGEKVTH